MIENHSKKYSIIISTFNEEDTIRGCLERIRRAAPAAEIILIHGGKDKTSQIARRWAREQQGEVRVIDNYGDCGKGHAIKVGISLAGYPVMAQFDADMQFAPEDLEKMVGPILEGKADLVIGSRFMEGVDKSGYQSSFFRDMGNSFLNGFISLLAGQKITDVTTGMKSWNRAAIWEIAFKDNRFVYEMEIVMRAALRGYRILQVPVNYASRQGGISGHGSGLKEFFSIACTGLIIAWRALLIRLHLY